MLYRLTLSLAATLFITAASAQVLSNQSLTGKYFFRHLSVVTDASGPVTDSRSLSGTITFDGSGRYTISGGPSGSYSVDPGGFVTLDNPIRSGATVNARLGSKIVIGSSTETSANAFDLFVAIPAPTTATAPAFTGGYWTATLEFPTAGVRNTFFPLNIASTGTFQNFTVSGHAANLSSGLPTTQPVSGATYTLNNDGTGTFNFGTSSVLLGGTRNIFLSDDGNFVIGGTNGGADILIGIKAQPGVSNSTWNSTFWAAGLRYAAGSTPPDVESYSGSLTATGQGTTIWTRRIKQLGFGQIDFTGLNNYSLTGNGSGTIELSQLALGATGKAVIFSTISASDPSAYEIGLAIQSGSLSGTGVFLNPRGVTSAASFSPAGAPISPGEFIALFGTGLAKSTQTASPPYPPTLNGVTVLINNKQAPIYAVSATQINCLVPYSTQGPTATIQIDNGGTKSNTVTVPVAPTSPGIYALNQSGTGAGAILHADYSLVNSAKPAAPGETVLIFLTGMGAVNPSVPDGTAGGSNPVSNAVANPVFVYIGGEPATVVYNGLAPGFPGLYQMNVTLPAFLPASGNLPLAIQTPNAFHDQVDIAVK